MARRVAGPRQPLGGVEHGDVGRGAGLGEHQIGAAPRRRAAAPDSGADRPARRRSPRGRRSSSCGAMVNRRARPSDSRSPRFDITSECSSSRMTRRSEPNRNGASSRGEQQRELLGRGEQDVGRIAALALALRGRRVAGARLDADRQRHLGDRAFEIARDVDRERLERRDVERVQAARAADAAAGGDELSCRCALRGSCLASACSRSAMLNLHQRRQETPPASCRRRSARSAAPSGPARAFASSSS